MKYTAASAGRSTFCGAQGFPGRQDHNGASIDYPGRVEIQDRSGPHRRRRSGHHARRRGIRGYRVRRRQLQGKSLRERALSLISIAHPDFRDELMEAAQQDHITLKKMPGARRQTGPSIRTTGNIRRQFHGVGRIFFRPAKTNR